MDVAVRPLNGLLIVAMPIVLGIYLVRRTGQRSRLLLAGFARVLCTFGGFDVD